jgi:hypothetical protein
MIASMPQRKKRKLSASSNTKTTLSAKKRQTSVLAPEDAMVRYVDRFIGDINKRSNKQHTPDREHIQNMRCVVTKNVNMKKACELIYEVNCAYGVGRIFKGISKDNLHLQLQHIVLHLQNR